MLNSNFFPNSPLSFPYLSLISLFFHLRAIIEYKLCLSHKSFKIFYLFFRLWKTTAYKGQNNGVVSAKHRCRNGKTTALFFRGKNGKKTGISEGENLPIKKEGRPNGLPPKKFCYKDSTIKGRDYQMSSGVSGLSYTSFGHSSRRSMCNSYRSLSKTFLKRI